MNDRRNIRMEVELERNIKDYIHNDIANAAHHLKKGIEARLEQDDREGSRRNPSVAAFRMHLLRHQHLEWGR